jgi:hypothetical protein
MIRYLLRLAGQTYRAVPDDHLKQPRLILFRIGIRLVMKAHAQRTVARAARPLC